MPKCKDCGTLYRNMDHSVYSCEEAQACAAGPVAYARFILKSADEGRVILGAGTRAAYEAQVANA